MGKIEGKLDLTEHVHKPYRATRKGPSFEKKKVEDKKKRGLPTEPEKLNPKAFATGRPGTYVHYATTNPPHTPLQCASRPQKA